MDFLDFVSRNKSIFPVAIIWPADAPVAMPGGATILAPDGGQVDAPGGRWSRLSDGRLEAIYIDRDELELCLTITGWIREPAFPAPAPAPPVQPVLLALPEPVRYE